METQTDVEDEYFVRVVSRYPDLLDKAKTPGAVERQNAALLRIQRDLEEKGINVPTKKINKKLSNIKTRLKKKSDLKRTGNRKIVLKKWEEDMQKFLQSEDNPVFNQIPGARSCGIPQPMSTSQQSDEEEDASSAPPMSGATYHEPVRDTPSAAQRTNDSNEKITSRRLPCETSETARLSNAECIACMQALQRLVLLEQLRFFRMRSRHELEPDAYQPRVQLPPSQSLGSFSGAVDQISYRSL